MTPGEATARENLTLTAADLAACQPLAGEGGQVLRARCPFHGSDHQRSLRVTLASGRFVCFACGAWGYLVEARERWRVEHQRQTPGRRPARLQRPRPPVPPQAPPRASAPAPADLAPQLTAFQSALPGSRGKATSGSGGFPSGWPNNMGWGMPRGAGGRTPPATGGVAAWSFRTPRLRGA